MRSLKVRLSAIIKARRFTIAFGPLIVTIALPGSVSVRRAEAGCKD
jgi:hypothetical protein